MTPEKIAVRKTYLEGLLADTDHDLEALEHDRMFRQSQLDIRITNRRMQIERRRKRVQDQIFKLHNTKIGRSRRGIN